MCMKVLGMGKGVLFREVSSFLECPYRGVPPCMEEERREIHVHVQ